MKKVESPGMACETEASVASRCMRSMKSAVSRCQEATTQSEREGGGGGKIYVQYKRGNL